MYVFDRFYPMSVQNRNSMNFSNKLNPWWGVGEAISVLRQFGGSDGKESAWNVGYLGLIPGSGRFPRKGHGYHSYSCLENPMHRGVWQATLHGFAESDLTEWLTFKSYFWLYLNKQTILLLKILYIYIYKTQIYTFYIYIYVYVLHRKWATELKLISLIVELICQFSWWVTLLY